MAARAEHLLNTELAPLKANLVLWNNGGPAIIPADTITADDNLDSDTEDSDSEDKESKDTLDISFNQLLVDMDAAAKKLAGRFVRTFGNPYLDSLVHGNPATYTSAMDVISVHNSGVRFGDLSKPRAKVAAELSTHRFGRTRAREHVIKNP